VERNIILYIAEKCIYCIYIAISSAVVASQICKITRNFEKFELTAVQGHRLRSQTKAQIELHATSY